MYWENGISGRIEMFSMLSSNVETLPSNISACTAQMLRVAFARLKLWLYVDIRSLVNARFSQLVIPFWSSENK